MSGDGSNNGDGQESEVTILARGSSCANCTRQLTNSVCSMQVAGGSEDALFRLRLCLSVEPTPLAPIQVSTRRLLSPSVYS